ncbi:hypothetical protein O181_027675 [Austropuccinia psidii MF-1]|uniref:Uncharacterized protein n=1 Tax=Austropuccinia psidii MF-1 TaxID=1389203 RepID=A0A9Q3H3F7_9BASI|nr:hypothetical protein [Austropuccinia psidii MF-1]
MVLWLAKKEDTYPVKARVLRELNEAVNSSLSLIHKPIQPEKIAANISPMPETIVPFPKKSWPKPLPINNIEVTKEDAIKKIKQLARDRAPQDVLIFTDGSDIPGKGKGAAAVATLSGLPDDFTPEEKKRLRVKHYPKKFNKALNT